MARVSDQAERSWRSWARRPHAADHPQLRAPNCNITSHIARATLQARTALINGIVRKVECFPAGEPEITVG